jgi:hypothetical protein
MIAALATAALAMPARAETADWAPDLTMQAERELGCDVGFLANIEEHMVDGRAVVDVKVNCTDGRAFDAHRSDVAEPFTFTQCEGTDLKAC